MVVRTRLRSIVLPIVLYLVLGVASSYLVWGASNGEHGLKAKAKFDAEAKTYAAQFDRFEPLPGLHIKGDQTLGENIADLGGVLIGLDAYHIALHGQPAPVLDGLTGDQRLLMAYAQSWRGKIRDDTLKMLLVSDVHSPYAFRVIGPMRNVDAWYAAFGVKPGDTYYLAPQDRVRIW